MRLSGDIPVSVIQDFQKSLESNGVMIEDFKVDVANNEVHIKTGLEVSRDVLDREISFEDIEEYIIDSVDQSTLDKVKEFFKGEQGSISLGGVGVMVSGGGTTGALVYESMMSGGSVAVAGIITLALGVGCVLLVAKRWYGI